ncbi:MAG: ankyrin repeat domain-containing protein [Bacteroidota bacterium]|nr:ankyrin repeat domain-containing protein [Bacteroidota bacterium]
MYKLCIAGKNNIAVEILEYSLNFFKANEICVIPNQTDSGKNTWQKSLIFYSKLLNIDIVSLEDIYNIPELIFLSLEFNKIINPNLFTSKKLFNIHFSLLPKYKGMYTSLFPILNGDEYSGVTIHCIDQGIDTGDIIDQVKFKLQNYTSRELYSKYMMEGIKLIKRNFVALIENKFYPIKQKFCNSTYYSIHSFDFNSLEIDLHKTAFQIDCFVRGMNFREYQQATYKNIPIRKIEILETKSLKKPGSLINENEFSYTVSTIDFDIKLYTDSYSNLLLACCHDDMELARTIIMNIENIDEPDSTGRTPLIIACCNGASNLVDLLIQQGADVNKPDTNGRSPIMYAKEYADRNGKFGIIHQLIKNGANLTQKDISRKSQ